MIMVFGTFVYGAAFSWFFIKWFGLLGAAYGLVLALLITAIVKHVILNKFIDVSLGKCWIKAIQNYPIMLKTLRDKIKK